MLLLLTLNNEQDEQDEQDGVGFWHKGIAGAQPDIFQGRGGFAELGHFNKKFFKNTRKKVPQGKFWKFPPRYS